MLTEPVPPEGTTQEDLLRRLAFAEAVTRATADCLYIFDIHDNEFRYQNTTVQAFLGYEEEELAALAAEDKDFYVHVGHPDEHQQALAALQEQRSMRLGQYSDFRYRLRRADGQYRWHRLRVMPFSAKEDGTPREVLGILRDVHDEVVNREMLDESERRFRELFDRSPSGLALVTDEGMFAEVNDALCEFLATCRSDLIGSSYDRVLHPDDRQDAQRAREVYRSERTTAPRTFRHHRRFVLADGGLRWARTSVTRVVDGGRPVNLVAFEDVTATKEIEERLRHAALHDSLTGLPNRRMLIDALDLALSRRRRSGRRLAVLFVDLDRVKQVNDQLGHEAGDDLLVRVSRRLELAMRVTDTIARVGGDEFVIVCPDLDSETEVPVLAERVLEALRVDVTGGVDGPLQVSGSIGIALACDDLDNANALIAAADRAMYEAKRSGRDRFHLLTDDASSVPVQA